MRLDADHSLGSDHERHCREDTGDGRPQITTCLLHRSSSIVSLNRGWQTGRTESEVRVRPLHGESLSLVKFALGLSLLALLNSERATQNEAPLKLDLALTYAARSLSM